MKLPIILAVVCISSLAAGQRVAPGVPPQQYAPNQPNQQYQPQQPNLQYQQQQQMPPQQYQPQQQQHQQMEFNQIPQNNVNNQPQMQPPLNNQQQQMPPPNSNINIQQHQVPVQPIQQQQHGGHQQHGGGHQQQQILTSANIANEKAHIAEHMDIPMDTSKMSEQELQFHYFKMHDADNNNKLDGCELIKSLIHWHEQGSKEQNGGGGHQHGGGGGGSHGTGGNHIEEKVFSDEELVALIDPILSMDDASRDGFIDYPEFVRAQSKAAKANN